MTPNEEVTNSVWVKPKALRLRDQHSETVKRTRPEGLGSGRKIGRRPSLNDYDRN